jgi:hypothetical protein
MLRQENQLHRPHLPHRSMVEILCHRNNVVACSLLVGDRRHQPRSVIPQQTNGECRMASKSPRWSLAGLFRVGKKKPAKPVATANTSSPYHAVSIIPGVDACEAAQRFTRHRFLSRNAPKLPLPACDAQRCTCRFKHHKDRRGGPRRRGEVGMMQAHWNGPERRRTGGRRSTDH